MGARFRKVRRFLASNCGLQYDRRDLCSQALQQQQQAQQLHQLHQLQQLGFDIRDLVAAGAGGSSAAGTGGGSAAPFDPISAVQASGSSAGSTTGGVESAFAGILQMCLVFSLARFFILAFVCQRDLRSWAAGPPAV